VKRRTVGADNPDRDFIGGSIHNVFAGMNLVPGFLGKPIIHGLYQFSAMEDM
jgi:hypothetical protein